MVTGSRPGRRFQLALACLTLLIPAVLSSCFDSLFELFPAYLTKLEATVDLDGALKKAGYTGTYNINRIEYLVSPVDGTSLVLVALNMWGGSYGNYLLVLDPDNLKVREIHQDLTYSQDPILISDITGTFLWEGYSIGTDGSILNSAYTTWFTDSTVATTDSTTVQNLSLGTQNLTLFMTYSSYYSLSYVVSADMVTPITSGTGTLTTDSSLYSRILDAVIDRGGRIRILLSVNSQLRELSFPTLAIFQAAVAAAGTTPLLDSAYAVTGPWINDSKAWLTTGGVIALKWTNGAELIRYSLDTFTEKDSQYLEKDGGDMSISFDPTGTWWLYLNRETGELAKLRTWW